jgi:hypothetical protein
MKTLKTVRVIDHMRVALAGRDFIYLQNGEPIVAGTIYDALDEHNVSAIIQYHEGQPMEVTLSLESLSFDISDKTGMERWQALGRNYTAVQKVQKDRPEQVILHLLDLDTMYLGIRISVTKKDNLRVEFPSFGKYSDVHTYSMDAVPVQPFRNEEKIKAWEEFIDAMSIEEMHEYSV